MYCAVAGLLVSGAVVGLATQLEGLVLDRVRGAAAQRGLLVEWEEASVSPTLAVNLRGVSLRGPNIETRAKSLQADLKWSTLASGTPQVESVRVEGLSGSVDLREFVRDVAHGTPGSSAGHRLGALGVIRIDGELTLKAPGKRQLHLDQLSMFGKPGDDTWQATVVADCVAGCGDDATRVDASVMHSERGWAASAQLDRPISLTELFADAVDPDKRAAVASLREVKSRHFELTTVDGVSQMAARRVEGALALAGWDGQFEVDRASIDRQGVVSLRRPRIVIGRRSAAGEGSTANRLRGLLTDPNAVTDVLAQVTRVLQTVHVDGGSVALEGVATLDDVDASARGGNAVVTGRVGGGTFRAFFGTDDDELRLETQDVRFGGLARRTQWGAAAELDGAVSGMLTLRPTLMAPSAPRSLAKRAHPVSTAHAWRSRGGLTLRRLRAHVPKVSGRPFENVAINLGYEAYYVPAEAPGEEDRLIVTAADATIPDGATVRFKGEARNVMQPAAAPLAFTMDVDVDEVDCQRALRTLPAATLPNLRDHIHATGTFAPGVSLLVDLERPYDADVEVRGLPGDCHLTDLGPWSPDVLNDDDYKHEVTEGTSRAGIFVGPASDSYVPIDAIPRHVAASAYLSEEILFPSNPGFAMGLMRKALRLNLDKGRYVYGGSSVSQQLVKNLFLTRHKTLSRKLEEALIVWRMEEVVGKRRILELYLNCIEFGPDLYGIGRASRHYFGKRVSDLTPLEGVFLAALKPAPWLGARYKRRGATPDAGWWPKRLQSLMERLVEGGHITHEEFVAAAPYVVTTFE